MLKIIYFRKYLLTIMTTQYVQP